MPNTIRQTNIRDLDAAIGNIDWCESKILAIGQQLLDGEKYYTDNKQPVPEQNQMLITGVDAIMETLETAKTAIKLLRDNI